MAHIARIALCIVVVLGAVPAWAATGHRIHHAATGTAAPTGPGPGIISDRCLPTGPPCRTHPDGW